MNITLYFIFFLKRIKKRSNILFYTKSSNKSQQLSPWCPSIHYAAVVFFFSYMYQLAFHSSSCFLYLSFISICSICLAFHKITIHIDTHVPLRLFFVFQIKCPFSSYNPPPPKRIRK